MREREGISDTFRKNITKAFDKIIAYSKEDKSAFWLISIIEAFIEVNIVKWAWKTNRSLLKMFKNPQSFWTDQEEIIYYNWFPSIR